MFRSWCRKQKFANGSNLSHVLMDGGVLSVPFDRLNDFYDMYVKAIKSGEKIYVVEQKTGTYNFFVDLDYKDDEHLSVERLEEIVRTICDRVTHFGGKDVLISVAEPKSVGNLIKHGVHMNWPNFVVDHGSAMALHSHIVSSLGILFPGKEWKNIVDTAVYGGGKRNVKGSGFRMPWSHKKAKHDACEGRGCEECENGKITQGEYRPVLMYTHEDSKLTRIFNQEPSVEIMWMATLRTENKTPVIVEGSTREEGSFSLRETKDVFSDQQTYQDIETFVQKNMDGQENAEITKIYINNNAYLVSTTSKYCENLQRSHASNHIWFLIEGQTISQRCFCTCETMKGRRYGFCRDFYGRKHILPDKVYKSLYKNGYKKQYTPTTPQNTCMPCPEVKKEDPVQVSQLLKTYITRNIVNGFDLSVKSVTKKSKLQHIVHTTYDCETCKKTNVQFKIMKNQIEQVCSCKNRKHILSDKIIRVL
jgi:hypothetical protein